MQPLLTKFSFAISAVFSKLLENGPGRAVVTDSGSTSSTGFSVFIQAIVSTLKDLFLNLGEFLLRMLAKLAYFVIKIVLNIMDFMGMIIKELSGQASISSLTKNSNYFESDILFQFLFNDTTISILKAVFAFSILLLIIFTIIAIVKQEWQAHIEGKVASIKKIFRKVLLSIFTMIITPFILIVGIVFSNVILASALNAFTKGSDVFSIGANLFTASTYEANKYRQYALEGLKVPIVFDYDGGFENVISTPLPEYSNESTSEYEKSLDKIATSGNFSTGQATYNMFKEENFYEFDAIYDSSKYYSIYDGPYLKTKQIEYFVMADFIDYAMQTGGKFYLVNVEDIYESVMEYISRYGLPNITANTVITEELNAYIERYKIGMSADVLTEEQEKQNVDLIFNIGAVLDNILAYNSANENILSNGVITEEYTIRQLADDYCSGLLTIDHYNFDVIYNGNIATSLNTEGVYNDGKCTYTSVGQSVDEVTGAKYMFCTRQEMGEDGGYIYKPVSVGTNINGFSFFSRFLDADAGKLFLARGIFSESGYPTAIKNEGRDVTFYRHEPNVPSIFNLSHIVNYMNNEGNSSGLGASNLLEAITGIDISSLIPDLSLGLNFLRVFTKTDYEAATLWGGQFTLNYSFVNTTMKLANIYDELSVNYVVLIFACCSLFMSLFYIIWGLITRLYEITLLWITMPAWIAKFPLEKDDNIGTGKTTFSMWKNNMIERITALFSIYVALSFILVLIPIVFQMDYITAFNISETNLFSVFDVETANLVIKTMFVLVLFGFLSLTSKNRGAKYIEDIILLSGKDDKGYITSIGEKTFKEVKAGVTKANAYFTPWGLYNTVKGAALNVSREAINAIPGKNIADRLIGGTADKINQKKNDESLQASREDLVNATDEDDISAKADELNKATNDHEMIEGYRTAKQDYWRKTSHDIDDKYTEFRQRSNNSGMKEIFSGVAKQGGGFKIKMGKRKIKARTDNRNRRKARFKK